MRSNFSYFYQFDVHNKQRYSSEDMRLALDRKNKTGKQCIWIATGSQILLVEGILQAPFLIQFLRRMTGTCFTVSPTVCRSSASEMNKDAYYLHLEQWKKRAKKPSVSFLEWQKVFLEPLEKRLSSSDK